jgi:NSS family neurotransmitter:Na+ symporter
MGEERGQWGTRIGFVFATIGSAVGLGNIWRFPYLTYENGGGAFLIPYFFALLTAGIPLILLEMGFGHKMMGSAPLSFARYNRKWEFLGWWPVFASILIMLYYTPIIAWAVNYIFFSFTQTWGADTAGFFFGTHLGLTEGLWNFGGIQWPIFIALAFIWFLNWLICYKGIQGGIEKACKIFIPLLAILVLIIAIRAITLPGALTGLEVYLKPDFSKITDGKVWVAAYGQVFFSLSVALGVMLAYASYLPRKTDIVNNAFITGLADTGFAFLAGLAVFGILGYMADVQGVPVKEVVKSGVGLAFVTFPQAISQLPKLNALFGILFFLCLAVAGLSSSISMMEAFASALMDKVHVSRHKIITITSIVGFLVSSLYATGAGLYILDIVDAFINSFGLVPIGLLECIAIGWLYKASKVRDHVNPISDFAVGAWYDILIKFVTPLVLIYSFTQNLIANLKEPYGGYSWDAVIVLGFGVAVILVVALSFYMQSRPWKAEDLVVSESQEVSN